MLSSRKAWASFVSPRMSRDTAAVRHRRRPHPAGNAVAQEDDIRLLWRRLPETCPRSYEANFFRGSQPPQDRWRGAWSYNSVAQNAGRRRCRTSALRAGWKRYREPLQSGWLLSGSRRGMFSRPLIFSDFETHASAMLLTFPRLTPIFGRGYHLGRVCGWQMCRSDLIHVHGFIYQVKIFCQ